MLIETFKAQDGDTFVLCAHKDLIEFLYGAKLENFRASVTGAEAEKVLNALAKGLHESVYAELLRLAAARFAIPHILGAVVKTATGEPAT